MIASHSALDQELRMRWRGGEAKDDALPTNVGAAADALAILLPEVIAESDDGTAVIDLNATWTAKPAKNPGAGAVVQPFMNINTRFAGRPASPQSHALRGIAPSVDHPPTRLATSIYRHSG